MSTVSTAMKDDRDRFWRRPLDADEVAVPHGQVQIIADRCKGCAFCVEYCPRDVLAMSAEFNAKGYHPPEVVRGEDCVNCGLCEMICPDFAIFCVSLSEDGTTILANPQSPTATV